MAKKKASEPKLGGAAVARLYLDLPRDEQYKFMEALQGSSSDHPIHKAIYGLFCQQWNTENALASAKKKIPKKRGNPERDALILRLAENHSDGEIAGNHDVTRLNHGKKMKAEAVQGVRRRHGKRKTRG